MENHQFSSQKLSSTLEQTMEGNNEIDSTETMEHEETSTLDIKKELAEEVCFAVSLPNPTDTDTLDVKKEFSEEDHSTVSLPDKSGEETDTLVIKKEFSEEDCYIVSLPESREDTGTLDVEKGVSEEYHSTVSLPDKSGAETDTIDIKKEFSEEECCKVSLPDRKEETGTLYIKKEFTEQDCSITPSTLMTQLPDHPKQNSDMLDIKVELSQEDCSTDPVTPIMSCVDSGSLDVKLEISEPVCFTASSMPFSRNDKPEDTSILRAKVQPAKKRATFISTPIIFLPDNLVEDINKFDIKVKFADQDWSTVPSTPKYFLPGKKNVSGISKSNSIKPTNNKSQTLLTAQSSVPSIPKRTVSIQKNVCVPLKTPLPSKKKLSCKSKRKRAALIAHGIPEDIAKALCVLPLPSLMEMFPNALNTIKPNQESQTPVTNAPKSATITADKPTCNEPAQKIVPASSTNEQRSVNSKNTALRVGIQNAQPMNKAEMTMVHRRLVSAISELGKGGGGPGFLNFQQMDGWIMVTCIDQRSRAWLVDKLKSLDLWPGAQLSIMPEQKISKQSVNKVIAFIPESEATNVQEALTLLKAQNKGLYTQQWKILNERLEIGKSWSILFIIDEPSLESLKAQNCQAAIGFKRMRFKIITAAGVSSNNSKSQFSKNQDQTGSQGSKGTNQKPPFSSTTGHQMPVRTGTGAIPVESQNISQDKSQSAQGENSGGAVTKRVESYVGTVNRKSDAQSSRSIVPIRSKEPSMLAATGRPMPHTRSELRSDMEDSRTGNSSQGGPGRDKPAMLAIEHILPAVRNRTEEQRQKTQTREHIIRVARDRIEKLRQKTHTGTTISEPNGSRWDEHPNQTRRKRPLETRDRDTVCPIINYSKRRREETSSSTGEKRPEAVRDQNKATKTNDRHSYTDIRERIETGRFRDNNGAQRISQDSQGIGRVPFVQDKMTNEIRTDHVEFSSQTTRGNLAMMPSRVQCITASGIGAPTVVTLGKSGTGGITITQQNRFSALIATGSGIATNHNGFSAQTIEGNQNIVPSGYGGSNAIVMGSGGTGSTTVAQHNEFSSQTTGRNIAMAPQMVIPGYCASVVNLATSGTQGIPVTPQNIPMAPQSIIPGYGASTVVNLATSGTEGITVTPQNIPMMSQSMVIPGYVMGNLGTGAGSITVPPQNSFSVLGSEIQEMDYFLGPGGGNQFVQNQMTFQNSLIYGDVASQQTALATMYPMNQCTNQSDNMNCYQTPQNGISSFNQQIGQKDSVLVQMSMDIDESEASRDSDASQSREKSKEGFYRSWIIQDAESFAASTAAHSALNAATGRMLPQTTCTYAAQINEDPNKHGIPSFAQGSSRSYLDTHSRSLNERLPPQNKDNKGPYERNSPSILYRRRSPEGRSGRDQDIEDKNYDSSTSREERGDRNRLLRDDKALSPQARIGFSAWIIEDLENYGKSRSNIEERDYRDKPLRPNRTQQAGSKGVYNSNRVIQDTERRNIRGEGDNRDKSSRQERNDYKCMVKEDNKSSDRSRSSGGRIDRLRSDRRSPQKSAYERRDTQAKRLDRNSDPASRDSSSRDQSPRDRDGYIRNRGDGLPREPGYQRGWRHEVRPRR